MGLNHAIKRGIFSAPAVLKSVAHVGLIKHRLRPTHRALFQDFPVSSSCTQVASQYSTSVDFAPCVFTEKMCKFKQHKFTCLSISSRCHIQHCLAVVDLGV
jgi:hypothetical protein